MAVSLKISITQNSQSAALNSSNVTVRVVASWTYGSFNRNKKPGYLIVDGRKQVFSASFNEDEEDSGSKVLYTWEGAIEHGTNGDKTLACSASYTTGVSSGTITATASKTLTPINRASTPTVSSSSVNMGGVVTINTNPASTSFTHDLAYSFAGGSYVSIATGVGASCAWRVPDLASKIPTVNSGTVTIRCITKSDGTVIGTKTVTMTIQVPATSAYMPSISDVAVEEATSGLAAQFGAFIKGKSKIKTTITAAGAKGSTIKSIRTTFNGRTYTGSSWTSGIVSASGSLSLTTTVTDTRNRVTIKTTPITVLDYSPPAIHLLHVVRVNTSGAEDQDGDEMRVTRSYSVASLNDKNTAKTVLEVKKATDTTWLTLETLNNTTLTGGLPIVPSVILSTDYQYDVRFTVTDWFGSSSTYTVQLPSGAVILDIGADGLSLSVGKTAEHARTFDTAWQIKAHFGEIPKDALTIPATANLNDYTTPGYYAFSSASSATIANLPNGGSGSGAVEIIREGESNQVRQVVTRCSVAAREIWERLYYSNTWQDWLCIYKGGTGRVLWGPGGYFMTADHRIELKEPVSKQPNGIVLVFSEYVDGEEKNYTFHRAFIDKTSLALHNGASCTFTMCTANLAYFAVKHLYIDDTSVAGHENNNKTGTGTCGITYTNNRFVLRYVIGV